MKNILLLLVFSIVFTPELFSSEAKTRHKAQCCGLDTVAYKIGSKLGRNDYLYLASVNSLWFLQKKIALKENIADLDKYWLRSGTSINGVKVLVYCTPLHEAVKQGSLDAVKELSAAGADKKKIIKHADIQRGDIAQESLSQPVSWIVYPVYPHQLDVEISNVLSECAVGLSAVDLAQKLMKDKHNEFAFASEQRKAIYEFLNN